MSIARYGVMIATVLCCGVSVACGPSTEDQQGADMFEEMGDMSEDLSEEMPSYDHLPYARAVVSFTPGEGAGYGQDRMPGVVLGPPAGKGTQAGALDVVSLGKGGEIVLSFGDHVIVDGPGVDFIVFENPFWVGNSPEGVFAELGEVSVSEDGETWQTFPCQREPTVMNTWPGCAGWSPTLRFDPLLVDPLVAANVGGDGFDLATLGVSSAKFVRIRDLATEAQSPTAGFDLDAVGIIHTEK